MCCRAIPSSCTSFLNSLIRHQVQAAQLAPETPSYFQDAILRWKELNLTAHYNEFVREVNPFKNSYADPMKIDVEFR